MKTTAYATGFALVTVGLMSGAAVRAQEQDTLPWVYTSFFKIPWERVDSLTELQKLYPWREKAKEMGCHLDRQVLVHHTGSEYNIVIMTTYATWKDMAPGGGCGQRVFEALEPDSTRRAEVNAGFNWVYTDVEHRDVIYQRMETP